MIISYHVLKYLNKLKKYKDDIRASTSVIVGLVFLILVIFAFLGLDAARAYMTYSRLSYAVDGAALAGARSYGQEDRDKVAEAFLKANFKSEDGVTLVPDGARVIPSMW